MNTKIKSNKKLDILITRHDEVSRRIQTIMYVILLVLLYFFLILGVSDTTMIENDWQIQLPFFGTNIDKSIFLIAGPLLLYILFLYFHSFIEHRQRIEARIRQNGGDSAFDSLLQDPSIFNFNRKLTRLATTFFVYGLIPLILIYFFIDSYTSSASFYTVAIITSIGICTATWKYLTHSKKTKLPLRKRMLFVGVEFVVGLALLLSLTLIWEKPKYAYNVSNANLAFENFSFKDLSRTNFYKANLTGARLMNTDLSHTNLSHAFLVDAQLSYAIINEALLKNSKFDNANLTKATIQNSDFEFAVLANVNMRVANAHHSNFRQVDFGEKAKLISTQFQGSDLSGSNMKYADLTNANIRADMSYALMSFADLTYANAVGAKLVGTKIRDATLSHIELERAVLIKAELQRSNLSKANLQKALLHGVDLSDARLTDANLSYAQLNSINADTYPWEEYQYGAVGDSLLFPEVQYQGITGPASVKGCDFSGTKLEMTNLSGVDLTEVNNLTLEEIIKAIGNESTQLPGYLQEHEAVIREAWRGRS